MQNYQNEINKYSIAVNENIGNIQNELAVKNGVIASLVQLIAALNAENNKNFSLLLGAKNGGQ